MRQPRRLTITKAAERSIRRLPTELQREIIAEVEAFAAGQRPNADIRKLRDWQEPEYRLRVGDYRVLLKLTGDEVKVNLVLPRSEAYTKRGRR